MDVKAYWDRIGFSPRQGETMQEQLIRLHRCHIMHIPFENFNPFCHAPVSLDIESIFQKVIWNQRGGYCFELNQLFQALLEEMGYTTMAVFCRPFSGEGVKLPLTHRLTIVYLDNQIWLCDIGLGGNCWIEPLLLDTKIEQPQFGRIYTITEEDGEYLIEWKKGPVQVKALSFRLSAAVESDFVMANYYTSTHADSPFVNRLMCVLPGMEERYSIRDNRFRKEKGAHVAELVLTEDNIEEVLKKYFHIELDADMFVPVKRYLRGFQH